MLWLFAFYIILVLMLTTFRDTYFPWQLTFHFDRPLSDINLVFMKETWKMFYAQSRVDFIYNSFGNVLCFIPIGLLTPIVFSKKADILAGYFIWDHFLSYYRGDAIPFRNRRK